MRNINDCNLIKKAIREGIGEPRVIDGKCEGYAGTSDEPHSKCPIAKVRKER